VPLAATVTSDETAQTTGERGFSHFTLHASDPLTVGVDFRLATRRDIKAARAFQKQARESARLYQRQSVTTDKTHSYARVIGEMNQFKYPDEGILHINRKWENNRIESDHAALEKLIMPMRGLKSLSSAKAALRGKSLWVG